METIKENETVENKPAAGGMTGKVLKGSFWTLAGQAVPILASFISTPFVIRFLGSEQYGVVILVGLILNNFSFGDFGMGFASTKFCSEQYAAGSRDGEAVVVRTAGLIALVSSVVVATPLFLFSSFIVGDLLRVGDGLRPTASLALKIAAVAFVFTSLGSVANTPQLSRLRMDVNSAITASGKLFMAVVTPLVLYLGGQVVAATVVAAVASVLILAGHLYASGKLLPELMNRGIDRALVGPLVRFGRGVVFYAIGLILLQNVEKLILTRLVSVKSLAYYSIAFTLANMTTMFSLAMVQSLIPAFSQLLAPERRGELNALFSRSLRVSMVALIPMIALLFVIARPFFTIWAGTEFGRESVVPFYVLLVGVVFSIFVYVPNSVMMAFGRPDILGKVFWIELVPYGLLAYWLILRYGIVGAAMAWTVREMITTVVLATCARRVVGISFDFLGESVRLGWAGIAFVPALIFAFFYDNFSLWLLPITVVSTLVYGFVIWKSVVTLDERHWFLGKLDAFRRRPVG